MANDGWFKIHNSNFMIQIYNERRMIRFSWYLLHEKTECEGLTVFYFTLHFQKKEYNKYIQKKSVSRTKLVTWKIKNKSPHVLRFGVNIHQTKKNRGLEGGEYYGSKEKGNKEGCKEEGGKEEDRQEGNQEEGHQEAQIVLPSVFG